ncbi:MAG: LacI family transcriptional regulator [Candidatus Pelagisphaera sp.]|jgi:LacI family transcriptional regulator
MPKMPKSQNKRISQMQIAKELGISQALVSMALNGRKKGISENAYKTIWEFALENGYSPRGMNLDTAKENTSVATVGYILRSPLKLANKSNFFSHIHQGLYDTLNDNEVKTIFLGSEDDIAKSDKDTPLTLPDSVKGIAIMGEVHPDFLQTIRKLNRPIVYISARESGKCHSVLSNESESAELLVDHLCELGHTNFAWLGGNRGMGRQEDRLNGISMALESRNLKLKTPFKINQIEADRKEGFEIAKKLIEQSKPEDLPTAWICLNGLMARGAINFLFQNGYKVGSDISVAAFDMTNVCNEEDPTITCAGANPEDMGSEAARILLSTIKEKSKALSDFILPTSIRIGKSTGPQLAPAMPVPERPVRS